MSKTRCLLLFFHISFIDCFDLNDEAEKLLQNSVIVDLVNQAFCVYFNELNLQNIRKLNFKGYESILLLQVL